MKPRLDSSELTLEDSFAWFNFLDRLRPLAISDRIWWKHQCRYADRRDADLMCKAGHWRRDGVTQALWFTGSTLPWPYELLPIDCGGAVGVYL
jgi:hypothetical protein